MAKKKKATKKVSRTPAPKKAAAKKAPAKKKAAARKAAPTKPAKAAPNPFPISTGKGPTPAEVGADLVAMFNQGKLPEIEAKWYSDLIESVEGVGVSMGWRGKAALKVKSDEWMSTHKILGASAEGPYVGATGFSVKFTMDVENTADNSRILMEEVGVYQVQNGKIVREEFMYVCRG